MRITATKNNQTNSWVMKDHLYGDLKIESIMCLSCLQNGDLEDFKKEKTERDYILAKIYKIKDDFSIMKSQTKTFFVETRLVPRGFAEGDNCEIHGILFSEVKNNAQIDSDGIFIK